MPPRATKKKAPAKDVGTAKTIDEHALDVELGEIDMKGMARYFLMAVSLHLMH
jgi:hypothetical protein